MRPVREGESAFLPGETSSQVLQGKDNPDRKVGLRLEESAEAIVPTRGLRWGRAERQEAAELWKVRWEERKAEKPERRDLPAWRRG